MSKAEQSPKFGSGHWVTMRHSGEHVKIEAWSPIAAAYRVRSRKSGLQFASEAELLDISPHPNVDLGKHWNRCQAPGCGAPLTADLPQCPRCQMAVCTCGRCQCTRRAAAAKPTRKKSAAAPR